MTNSLKHRVRAVQCDYRSGEEEIYQALKRATDPLTQSWRRLKAAKRIGIKFNQDWLEQPPIFEGQFRELVSEKFARATLRLLRENTGAQLFAADASFFEAYENGDPDQSARLLPVFREFGVEYVYANHPPIDVCEVPGGGLMFRRYFMSRCLLEADEIISVQKMKNHAFMGITLSLKNLFGLMPTEPLGRPRHYYHHLVRMPYMLVDLGRILNPALNIIDALTGQAGREWGGEGRITNALIAGDHPITTDAVGASLMGHDPQSDWLTPPFHRDRSALQVASESGWGTTDLSLIDYEFEVQPPLAEFHADSTDSRQRVVSWRRTTAEQALYYRDHRKQLMDRYAGEYILLQQGEVRWHDKSGRLGMSRRTIAGNNPDEAMWFKYIDPEDVEDEHYEVYEKTLAEIQAQGL